MTRVLPEPAPAMMRRGPSRAGDRVVLFGVELGLVVDSHKDLDYSPEPAAWTMAETREAKASGSGSIHSMPGRSRKKVIWRLA